MKLHLTHSMANVVSIENPIFKCHHMLIKLLPFLSQHLLHCFFHHTGFNVGQPEGTGYRSWSIWELAAQRHTTWAHLALHAADQLRMKTAWSLSQIVAVGLPGSGTTFNEETEHY